LTYLIAASRLDPAASNIAAKLIAKYGFKAGGQHAGGGEVYERGDVKLVYLDVDSITLTELWGFSDVEGVAFASRHKSESGKPTLTVHVPGNLTSEARHGGRPRELAWAWPQRMKSALKKLWDLGGRLKTEYTVSLEATHHGPTALGVPIWFVEIGSSEQYWEDEEAGEAVAEAIWASLTEQPRGRSCVGFGGGHYAPKHTQLCLESDLAVGHIFPKYLLDSVESSTVVEAFRKTVGECDTAVIDWKGLNGPQRDRLLAILREEKIAEVVKA